jgi:hypothetical protein
MVKDQDIVQLREIEIKVFEDVVHETLEGLGGVSGAKGLAGKFEYANRSGNGCLLDVVRVHGNLVVGSDEVDFG